MMLAWAALALGGLGCSTTNHPTNGIHGLPPTPTLPARLEPVVPPKAPTQDGKAGLALQATDAAPLELATLLASVDTHFPLILAMQEERVIADGQRLAAEGAFDTNFRTRYTQQEGTFPSSRFDLGIDQPTSLWGINVFSGYRYGQVDFPAYYGDRLTADGGELRAGVAIPFLKDGPIDRRRAAARQAQIQRSLAEPAVQKARLDSFRAAARAYWAWVGAAEQVFVAEDLLRIARERQSAFETQFKKGQISEFVTIDNRRLVVEREGALVSAERRFQQTAIELSLFYRDEGANAIVPAANRIPRGVLERLERAPELTQVASLAEEAIRQRPEIRRFELQKERVGVDRRLFENHLLPSLNASVSGSQDVGKGKKGTGTSALDRSVLEGAVLVEVPLQRRDASGKLAATRGQMDQLLHLERYARDQIIADLQDVLSNLERTRVRIEKAREERTIADRVAALELERFQKGQSSLLEVNLRELAAAAARAKVVDALADYQRAQADLRAVLGRDGQP